MLYTHGSTQADNSWMGGSRRSPLLHFLKFSRLLAAGAKRVYGLDQSLQSHPFSPTGLGQIEHALVKCHEHIGLMCIQEQNSVPVKAN